MQMSGREETVGAALDEATRVVLCRPRREEETWAVSKRSSELFFGGTGQELIGDSNFNRKRHECRKINDR